MQKLVGFGIGVTYVILKNEVAIENTQDFVGFYTLPIFIYVRLSQCLIHSRHLINTSGDGTQPVLFTKKKICFYTT